ncbi:MAG: DUF4332 domain-containing protein [Bacteroidota bacterium]
MAKISEIEGIGPTYATKLTAVGISTVESFLKRSCSKNGRADLADITGLSEKMILEWANMADLFRVKGVRTQYAELLKAAGVDTVKELRTRRPDNLHQKMVEVNNERKLVRQVASLSQVTQFVEQAKTLDPMITH